MISILKTFGKGLLYVIGAPFFILALLLLGVIGLFAFVFQIFKSIIFFFTGQKFFPELPEDKELRLKLEAANQQNYINNENEQSIISPLYEEVHQEPLPEPEPTPLYVERNEPERTIEETVFEDTSSLEDLIQEEETEPPVQEEEKIEEEATPAEAPKEIKIEEEFEELETYVPRSSNTYTDIDDDEEENTDSGVDINYDL